MTCSEHIHLYTRHLTLRQAPLEEMYDDMELLPLGYQREGELIMQLALWVFVRDWMSLYEVLLESSQTAIIVTASLKEDERGGQG
jgi:hypothetical protein